MKLTRRSLSFFYFSTNISNIKASVSQSWSVLIRIDPGIQILAWRSIRGKVDRNRSSITQKQQENHTFCLPSTSINTEPLPVTMKGAGLSQ
jgi:hypothetical protein